MATAVVVYCYILYKQTVVGINFHPLQEKEHNISNRIDKMLVDLELGIKKVRRLIWHSLLRNTAQANLQNYILILFTKS